jgi:hypothetical protein
VSEIVHRRLRAPLWAFIGRLVLVLAIGAVFAVAGAAVFAVAVVIVVVLAVRRYRTRSGARPLGHVI